MCQNLTDAIEEIGFQWKREKNSSSSSLELAAYGKIGEKEKENEKEEDGRMLR